MLRKDVEREIKLRQQSYNKELENYLNWIKLRVKVISSIPIMRSDVTYDQATKCTLRAKN